MIKIIIKDSKKIKVREEYFWRNWQSAWSRIVPSRVRAPQVAHFEKSDDFFNVAFTGNRTRAALAKRKSLTTRPPMCSLVSSAKTSYFSAKIPSLNFLTSKLLNTKTALYCSTMIPWGCLVALGEREEIKKFWWSESIDTNLWSLRLSWSLTAWSQ